jgi:hypothetical protein
MSGKKYKLIIESDSEEENEKEFHIVTITSKEQEKNDIEANIYEEEKECDNDILLKKLDEAGIDKLVSIYGDKFKRRITNMKCTSIPLEKRKNLIKTKILEQVVKSENINISREILDTYFVEKEKKEKDTPSWLNDYVVGEEVFILSAKPQNRGRYVNRKAIISKINKKSLSVRLYGYNEIDDLNAIQNQTYGYNRLVWWDFTNDSQIMYDNRNIIKIENLTGCYAEEFIEGRRSVDYGW